MALPDVHVVTIIAFAVLCLNAPTGAWCSLTIKTLEKEISAMSQCTYRCVVLPDDDASIMSGPISSVSMHLQVRGAP